MQCKKTDALSVESFDECVADAERFEPTLRELFVCTTASRDVALQKHARLVTQARIKEGKFKVFILFWEDLSLELAGNKHLLAKHFPAWGALSVSDAAPVLTLSLVIGGIATSNLTMSPVPKRLVDLATHLRVFTTDELDDPAVSKAERELGVQFNEQVKDLLEDADNSAAWYLQNAKSRRDEYGRRIELRVTNDIATATDILVTLSIPAEFEVWPYDEKSPRVDPLQLPHRPCIGRQRLLQQQLRKLESLINPFKGLNAFQVVVPMFDPIPLSVTFLRDVRLERNVATVSMKQLAPRRSITFDGDDDALILVPPSTPGEYEMQWKIDAGNLREPCSGSIKVIVENAAVLVSQVD